MANIPTCLNKNLGSFTRKNCRQYKIGSKPEIMISMKIDNNQKPTPYARKLNKRINSEPSNGLFIGYDKSGVFGVD
jgi:hypothetical protein